MATTSSQILPSLPTVAGAYRSATNGVPKKAIGKLCTDLSLPTILWTRCISKTDRPLGDFEKAEISWGFPRQIQPSALHRADGVAFSQPKLKV